MDKVSQERSCDRRTASKSLNQMQVPPVWGPVVVLIGLECIWASTCHFSIVGWWQIGLAVMPLLAISVANCVYRRWMKLQPVLNAAFTWIAFTIVGCVLSYLCARNATQLCDTDLIRIDHAIGFDWLAWNAWVHDHPIVQFVLHISYPSHLFQILLLCYSLPLLGIPERNLELFWAAFWALIITCAVFRMFPAVGAFEYYGFDAQAQWKQDLSALRLDSSVQFDLREMKGIVSFPSFHATLAVLFTYTFRSTGYLGIAVGILNAAMLVSALSEGGHYLVDVIAGVIVALGSIELMRGASRVWSAVRMSFQTPGPSVM